jgi:hypothetical protein
MKLTIPWRCICSSVRAVRRDPAMMSGFGAIILAVSVLAGIFFSYADRHELAVDLGKRMPFSGMYRPADL